MVSGAPTSRESDAAPGSGARAPGKPLVDRIRSGRARYAVALLSVAAALISKRLLVPVSPFEDHPFLLLFGAVTLSAWYGGMLPGLLATGASAGAVSWILGANFDVDGADLLVPAGLFVLEGTLVSALSSALLSARRGAETSRAELLRQSEELRRGEERFRLLIERVEEYAILMLDPLGRVTTWNAGAQRIYGYQEDEIVGRHVSMLYAREAGEAGQPRRDLEDALREGRVDDDGPRVRKDGSDFHASVVTTPLFGESGDLLGFLEITRDISRRKRLEAERERLLTEARRAIRVKEEFLTTLSHELRTPLTSLLGWTQMLRAGILDGDTATRGFEIIDESTKLLVRLIDDLLDISRLVQGKLGMDLRPVEVGPIVESVAEALTPTAEAKGVRLDVTLDEARVLVSGDPDRLRQIVWNLLTNALKFTPAEGRIDVRLERDGSHARFVVADTGTGIEPAFLPCVFERFSLGDPSTTRQQGGLGLGLALTRKLVELHGGTITADSPGPNQGSTFTVTAPILAVHNRPLHLRHVEPLSESASGFHFQPMLAGLHLLVVEDEPDARELIAVVLRQCGAEVVAVGSVSEALEALDRQVPDVLVSDIGLPGENGYDLIRKIRERENAHGRHIPAAALTCYARDEDRRRSLSAGFQLHVVKPVEPEELTRTVAKLAGRVA